MTSTEHTEQLLVMHRLERKQHYVSVVESGFLNGISLRNREILMSWMLDWQHRFGHASRVVSLAIAVVDRYLARTRVPLRQLQLLGLVALWLAQDMEGACGRDDGARLTARVIADCFVIDAKTGKAEHAMAEVVALQLSVLQLSVLQLVLPVDFLVYFGEEGNHDARCVLDCALLLLCHAYLPSQLAAAAILATRRQQGGKAITAWPSRLRQCTGYTMEDLAQPTADLTLVLETVKANPSWRAQLRALHPRVKCLLDDEPTDRPPILCARQRSLWPA